MRARHAPDPDDASLNRTMRRGLSLLRAFRPGLSVQTNGDLAERCGLPRSTVSRLTGALVESGLLRQLPLRFRAEGRKADEYRPESRNFDERKKPDWKNDSRKNEGRDFSERKFEGRRSEDRDFIDRKPGGWKGEGRTEDRKPEGRDFGDRKFEGRKFDDRRTEARTELTALARTDGAAKWGLEIAHELRLLDEADQSPTTDGETTEEAKIPVTTAIRRAA